ncbi:MAG: Fmu (Sun) domain-containing protein [Ginsengibacter sp.]
MNTDELSSLPVGNYFHRYLNYAISLLENYKAGEPFHLYLKKYFSSSKKHGSKDRRQISSLCYNYFRLGLGVSSTIAVPEKLLLATFLFEKNTSALLEHLKPEWNKKIEWDLERKIKSEKKIFNPQKIFPFREELSQQINFDQFNLSFLKQPKLFIRIRPERENSVFDKLKNANISFEKTRKNCLAFSNATKITDILSIDKDAVIQDYNSQKTGDVLKEQIKLPVHGFLVWDCCAASGGKSILVYDLLKNIELTVSDTRKNILQNLGLRFQKAGIKDYTSFTADLSFSTSLKSIKTPFDLIIADVPCSGSGTWARTPEQLLFFNKDEILKYAELQQKIVLNAEKYLKDGGYFLYITCSVFAKENEENVNFFQQRTNFKLIKAEYLRGYEMQADTLFAALFKKPVKE